MLDLANKKNDALALQLAAEKGMQGLVKRLLGHGVGANIETDRGARALVSATVAGHEKVVQLLLEAGTDVNFSTGCTALQAASSNGHKTIVQTLLKKGAKVNAPAGSIKGDTPYESMHLEPREMTALQAAKRSGNHEIVHILLGASAEDT